ncbi:thioredoxin family protein [Alicyclobacillus sp. SO9]|uniref:thioredoxin family protein n=1 Tax=Alicyclobacillus sp. SO9 TaxID=2665646 RepID=UPI0018E80E8B|nr:thioredoxin family protein [Alicyclobacillus sp. SO9]QQE78191.1 thioredoxin family protein [Alicyclobacillus sp. SO9]
MPQIEESDKQAIKNLFAHKMEGTAHIRFFTSKANCQYCEDTLDILNQLAQLSDKIDLQVFDKDANADEARQFGVNMYPAIVFVNDNGHDTGVHFYGIPSGYEFSTLIEDIVDVANNHTDLSPETIDVLKQINTDVTLSVFITPT